MTRAMWIGLAGVLATGCGVTCITMDCLSVAVIELGVAPEAGLWRLELTRDGRSTLVCEAEVEATDDGLRGACGDLGTGFEEVDGQLVVTIEDPDAEPDGEPVTATATLSFEGAEVAQLSGALVVEDTRWLCQPKRAGGACVTSRWVDDLGTN